ncbi:cytochrome b/b6 domain-containing protein [Streptomyces scabiei]|uniref:cytochrome b/b6 domain-containing protein n=1 Tax=Streptomyces scabiei TaxID=1930 RepID=UPI003A8DA870
MPQTGRSAYGIATAAALLLIPVSVLVGGDAYREFLDFGAGVLSLVSLTCSVLWGLVAQDRTLLTVRQRIIGQAVHRTTAIASVAFLVLHVTVKLALNHVSALALFPFALGVTGTGALIGFGATAGSMMVFVAITGALRSNFASPAPVAARWRAMHMMAYPAWCFALVHGLYAGREAKPVFVTLYSVGLIAVAAALLLRAAPREVKRQVVERVAAVLGTDGQRPPEVDELVKSRAARQGMEESGGGRREGGRRDQMRDSGQFPLPGFGGGQGNPPLGDPLVPPQRGAAARRRQRPRFRGRVPRGVDDAAARAGAAHRGLPDPAAAAVGHAAHPGHAPDGRRFDHGEHPLAGPVPAAGRRGAPVVVRPDAGHVRRTAAGRAELPGPGVPGSDLPGRDVQHGRFRNFLRNP